MKSNKRIIKKILKLLILSIIVVFAFVLQTSLCPLIPFLKASPNLLLFMTFISGFIYGESTGLFIGIMCGIILDIFYTGQFGYFSLIYIIIGYVNGIINHYVYEDNISFLMILSISNSLILNFYIYISNFLLKGRGSFLHSFLNIMLPSIIMTLLISILLYKLAFMLKSREDKLY
ncbi:MAG: rod shape-determining protein MreD [Eubacteriales bacterium]|nr:rod shape-determining protein MreD [Eubacteriales bacterium]